MRNCRVPGIVATAGQVHAALLPDSRTGDCSFCGVVGRSTKYSFSWSASSDSVGELLQALQSQRSVALQGGVLTNGFLHLKHLRLQAPVVTVVGFGLYCVITLLYGVATFRTVPEEAAALRQVL